MLELVIILLLSVSLVYFLFKYLNLYSNFSLKIANYKETELKKQMDEYKATLQKQFDQMVHENAQSAYAKALEMVEKWKIEYEEVTRKDAIKKSQSISAGKMTEHLLPYFSSFNYNPKDARFLGSSVDLIVFDGLSEGQLKQIIFIEIKTNKSQLSQREKQIRDILSSEKVKWEEIRHMINENVK